VALATTGETPKDAMRAGVLGNNVVGNNVE
jgi:hypothetical protein